MARNYGSSGQSEVLSGVFDVYACVLCVACHLGHCKGPVLFFFYISNITQRHTVSCVFEEKRKVECE